MNIGLSIRRMREDSGLEQQELAEKIGISRALMSYIETGSRSPSLSVVIALSDVLHCSIDELIGRKVS